MVRFSPEPIDPAKVYDQMGKEGSGSVLLHFALARAMCSDKGITNGIYYQPAGDVLAEMAAIATEILGKREPTDLLVRRRGAVTLGEIISLVGVSFPRSESTFEACRFGLGRLKKMSSISKTEITF
jgi:molybdopterin synthase catalytic subunit